MSSAPDDCFVPKTPGWTLICRASECNYYDGSMVSEIVEISLHCEIDKFQHIGYPIIWDR